MRSGTVDQTAITSFFVEGHKGQNYATVDEHDVGVNFTCLVDLASTVQIVFEGIILKEASNVKSLSFLRNNVDCFHAGVYTCTGSRLYGQPASTNVHLFVRCSPRPLRQVRRNVTSQLEVPVTLNFTALAYPEPGPKGFSWYKENGIRWTPLLSNEDIQIYSSELQSNLTIKSVSPTDYGQYRVTVTNNISSYDQYLFLTENGAYSYGSCGRTESDNTALITGIVLGSVCTILVIYATYLTILHKRKTKNKGTETSKGSNRERTYVNQAYKGNVEGDGRVRYRQNNTDDENIVEESPTNQYTDLTRFTRNDKATYDLIQAN